MYAHLTRCLNQSCSLKRNNGNATADHEVCRRPSLSNGRGIGAYCSETCKKVCTCCLVSPLHLVSCRPYQICSVFFFQVSARLSDMVGVTNHTEDGFSWALLKIQKDEAVSSQDTAAVLECNVKLAVALGVLNECFNPAKDRRTKIDMLHQAVYSLG